YPTQLPFSVLAVTTPVISSAPTAIESFIFASIYILQMMKHHARSITSKSTGRRTFQQPLLCLVDLERRRENSTPLGFEPQRLLTDVAPSILNGAIIARRGLLPSSSPHQQPSSYSTCPLPDLAGNR